MLVVTSYCMLSNTYRNIAILSVVMLDDIMPSIAYLISVILSGVKLSFVQLKVIRLSVVQLSVVMLNVVAPN
jgi:hypothetical protein